MEFLTTKLFIIKQAIILVILTLFATNSQAQFFKKLVPQEVIVQHAGSIGFMEIGAGYKLFKNKRGSLDFTYGYVPESKGGSLNILAAKFAYRPIEIGLTDWAKLYPVNPGMFISYHLGKDYRFLPYDDNRPKGYYWWSTAMRIHLSVSNEVSLNAQKFFGKGKIKTLSVYSEFNTNELYLVSILQNTGGVALKEVIKLGLGVRIGF